MGQIDSLGRDGLDLCELPDDPAPDAKAKDCATTQFQPRNDGGADVCRDASRECKPTVAPADSPTTRAS